ncbi:hypothetical protein CO057_00715 [Candidatus Uhrbacteria bacterium CG_4_9_14_0_2_um_filter_41_50]|uniref:Pyrimidine dimer DNA glycosylase n=1 Tax=Candidatus Uhrbacteria bacterium CG_4_9_14_0_2_um_filter_41_50 TaxID=1975031 RepID=A0A2M8EQ30_9BACT|nr:MAG: hypothetical protein COZ45_02120 [Candidatus Uhrbacteria bacterium CG_4_10_14_3_um_filter_41_21]PIZ54688.1 MAG: hypothetical protein COY24_02880 [Candidatus Uhrbacteria bacterium CG_4_10_14_0_2_um_filter_41_21]PJB84753.1 MAG: hypothetical protein CO086_02035 [Candidatus Uhrbacteria bacterium CG_4_9_14_0_8_um_filter_41_16]PJC24855.1 MAG: hypothetical protein CO057_00715 [Candidatus Uhrbacteria bacterium CG_4_9_14_0_2_um_filter_41_50]PJE75255.1 MAG: hypothetical protein COV03_01305 [Candi
MRVWDIHPKYLCRKHLLGEHRELHGLWNILTKHDGKGGYSQHPETKCWVGKLRALYDRHQALVEEMKKRGYNHASDLDQSLATGQGEQDTLIDTIENQKNILKEKPCDCLLHILKNNKSPNGDFLLPAECMFRFHNYVVITSFYSTLWNALVKCQVSKLTSVI